MVKSNDAAAPVWRDHLAASSDSLFNPTRRILPVSVAAGLAAFKVAAGLIVLAGCDSGEQSVHHAASLSPIESRQPIEPAVITQRVLGDSDDPAIWINPEDPAGSLILGTDKHRTNGGVYVFDLDGRIDRTRSVTGLKRVNNVDVEYGLKLGGNLVDIAVATERDRGMLRVFALPDMTPIDGGGIPVFNGTWRRAPMGVALYKRSDDGAIFAIVSRKAGPRNRYLWQYRLEDDGDGGVRGIKVRKFGAFSGSGQIEALAVDDALGYVYYSDELYGIRKYFADPRMGDEELAVFGKSGFAVDREGISIYETGIESGYILVSDQGGNRLRIFPRRGLEESGREHPLLAAIPVRASDTDGIAATSTSLGTEFPTGMVVMMTKDRSFHYYRWEDIEPFLP